MRILLFYHSLLSDWNHGNAHFLRGITAEMFNRNHDVTVFEPANNWSLSNLLSEYGKEAVMDFQKRYPTLQSTFYEPAKLNIAKELSEADLVIVHEWNEHALVKAIGDYRASHPHFRLLFHDTHHRAVTDRKGIAACDLRHYDGVLAFGNVIRDMYLREGWAKNAWTWHEAADTQVFHPLPSIKPESDLVWVGNWGDDERTAELHEFLVEPVKELGLKATIYGVRYPDSAQKALKEAGIRYANWLPNYRAPEVFAQHKVTVHVPRRPYTQALPGIPTIRPFEALACGIPLISAPWQDTEGLFRKGKDYLEAKDGREMKRLLQRVLEEKELASSLSSNGLETIRNRHTCVHRVDELLSICNELSLPTKIPIEVVVE